jgi:electron transfer flavoprotein alpha subunit
VGAAADLAAADLVADLAAGAPEGMTALPTRATGVDLAEVDRVAALIVAAPATTILAVDLAGAALLVDRVVQAGRVAVRARLMRRRQHLTRAPPTALREAVSPV